MIWYKINDLALPMKGLTVMRGFAVVVALGVLLAASPTFAQAPVPPAPMAPAAQPAPRPFPEGSKVAYVVLQRIANESADGRVATTRIQALQQKKAAELDGKQKQLTSLQARLEKEGSVMSAAVSGDIQKQIEKIQVEVQRFTQDAQAEVQELQQNLQAEFQQRLEPVLQAVAAEKGLQFVFNGPDAGLVWADPSLDISSDVIKKLDSAKPAAPKPPAAPAAAPAATKPPAPTKPPGR